VTRKITALAAVSLIVLASAVGPARAQVACGSGMVSGAENMNMGVSTYKDYDANLRGIYYNVTFNVCSNNKRLVYSAVSGNGSVSNEKGDTISGNGLQTIDDLLAIPVKQGATFKFAAYGAPADPIWSDAKPKDFVSLTLRGAQDWTVDDAHFAFALEVRIPRLIVLLPESVTRASVITIPQGTVTLFGYRITAPASGAKVKFQKGAVIGCTGCTSRKL